MEPLLLSTTLEPIHIPYALVWYFEMGRILIVAQSLMGFSPGMPLPISGLSPEKTLSNPDIRPQNRPIPEQEDEATKHHPGIGSGPGGHGFRVI